MTGSIRGRRGPLLLAGVGVAAALLMSGCGAGQIAETANIAPGVPGVNTATSDGLFKVRNLTLVYPGSQGYPAGGDAPVDVALYNDSDRPVTVEISTPDARGVVLGGTTPEASPDASGAASPSGEPSGTPSAGAAPEPTDAAGAPAAPEPAPAPAGPARVEIPAGSFVLLNGVANTDRLRLVGLGRALTPGDAVTLVFDFGGQRLEASARVSVPLTPLPREESPGGAGHS